MGALLCWFAGCQQLQLGVLTNESHLHTHSYIGFEHGVKKQAKPFHIKAVERYGAPVSVACGANHSVVVTSNGVAVAWGDGAQGQLGRRVLGASLRGNRHRRVLLTPYKVLVGHAAHSRSGLKVGQAEIRCWLRLVLGTTP